MTRRESLGECRKRPSWRAAVRRWALAFAVLLAGLSFVGSSVVHATEPVRCIDIQQAVQLGHASGDGDQVPSDAEKGYAHHHGGCHGHQIGEPHRVETVAESPSEANLNIPVLAGVSPSAPTDPGTRPPIA